MKNRMKGSKQRPDSDEDDDLGNDYQEMGKYKQVALSRNNLIKYHETHDREVVLDQPAHGHKEFVDSYLHDISKNKSLSDS